MDTFSSSPHETETTYSSIITKYDYFTHEEWIRRYTAVKERIREKNIDGLLITSTENIFYLTGFHTTGYYFFQCLYIPADGQPFLLVRKMERIGAITQSWLPEDQIHSYYDTEEPIQQLSHRIRETEQYASIGYEKKSALFPATIQDKLQMMISSSTFVDIGGIVEEIRQVKSDQEIQLIQQVAKSTVEGMKAGINSIRPGVRDNEIAANIYYHCFLSGGEYPACPSFVSIGERGSIGHSTWNGTQVKENDIVFLEVSASKYRYHAPMMRTCYVGKQLPPLMREAERLMIQCLEECKQAMKPATPIYEVDLLSKQILNNNSFDYVYDNRLGYSIGCAFAPGWGEDTVITIHSLEKRCFRENMVFHLIPFMMIPNIGTVGISETVIITPDGAKAVVDFPQEISLITPPNPQPQPKLSET